jgi:hypothetical protein
VCAWQGYRLGYDACELDRAQQLEQEREAARKLDQARMALLIERNALLDELEVLANEDPVAVEQCFGPDRVRRLNLNR